MHDVTVRRGIVAECTTNEPTGHRDEGRKRQCANPPAVGERNRQFAGLECDAKPRQTNLTATELRVEDTTSEPTGHRVEGRKNTLSGRVGSWIELGELHDWTRTLG